MKVNCKKIQKIKKYQCGLIISQNRFEKAGKERKEKLSFRSYPMCNRKFQKNSKKEKKKDIRLWFISSQNRSEKDEKYGK